MSNFDLHTLCFKNLAFSVTEQGNEMRVTFVQHEQVDRSITILLYHACSFLQNRRDAEIFSMYLILLIAPLVSGTHANKVYDAAPMVSEIQEIVLRDDVWSDWE